MKILYSVGNPGKRTDHTVYSGNICHIVNLTRAFTQLGNEVISVSAGAGKKERKTASYFRLLKQIIPGTVSSAMREIYKIWYNVPFYRTYKKVFQDESPDFVYERYSHFHVSTSVIAEQFGIPYIVEINCPVEERKWSGPAHFSSIASAIQKRVATRADAIVTVSMGMKNYLIERGIPSERIYVLPNGADCQLFDPQAIDGEEVRNKYNLKGKTVVGFVASMEDYHGVGLLAQAAKQLTESADNIHFLLVGPSTQLEFLKKEDLVECFTLTGGVPYERIPEYISSMDICVVPASNWYFSPIKVFEYGAMGKPVIAPRVGPIQEVIEHGTNGILTKPGDAKDLAEKIQQLARRRLLRAKLGSNLMGRVRQYHTWKKNAQRTIDIYQAIRNRDQ